MRLNIGHKTSGKKSPITGNIDAVFEHSNVVSHSYKLYEEQFLRYNILEYVASNKQVNAKDIQHYVIKQSRNKEMYHKAHSSDVANAIQYLEAINFISVTSRNEICITEIGLKSLRECTLQNLTQSAFFGYKSIEFSNKSLCLSKLSFWIALIAAVCALITTIISFGIKN